MLEVSQTAKPAKDPAEEKRAMLPIENSDLLLNRAYHWEKARGNEVYMTQPMGRGVVRDYTWKQTVDEARRMAAYLKAQNFPEKSKIAILSKNCAHFIMSDLAIWMAGHVSVALYPTLNAETVEYILEHSEAKLLFVGKLDDWQDMKPGVPEELPCVSYPLSPPNDYPTWEDIIAKTDPIPDSPTRDADDMAILVYTSGSTGRPKGVVHNFGNLARGQKGFEQVIGFDENDRMLSYLPLAHVFERAAVEAASLFNGNRIYFAESLDTFAQDLQRARPTVFHSVPRLWLKFQLGVFQKLPEQRLAKLLKLPIIGRLIKKKVLTGLGLDQCRMAISGSAPIPPELIQWYNDLGVELLEGYAMSENFAYSHFTRPGEVRPGYVGKAAPGCSVRISEEGEIQVKSPCDMQGYYKQPELSKDAFTEDGYLKTGDRGEELPDGTLRITGRVKELFKTSKGKYVAPAPIENIINADSHVEASCVAGAGYDKPHAVVMLSEQLRGRAGDPSLKAELEPVLKNLLKQVNNEVEVFEQLAYLAVVKEEWGIENGFLTPTMKIKRDIIEKRYEPSVDGWYDAKQPVVWE